MHAYSTVVTSYNDNSYSMDLYCIYRKQLDLYTMNVGELILSKSAAVESININLAILNNAVMSL